MHYPTNKRDDSVFSLQQSCSRVEFMSNSDLLVGAEPLLTKQVQPSSCPSADPLCLLTFFLLSAIMRVFQERQIQLNTIT